MLKKRLAKWLSALLIAALLLTPVALMEEAPETDASVIVDAPAETVAEETAEETVEEAAEPEKAPAEEPAEEVVEDADAEIAVEAVDEVVTEEDAAALGIEAEAYADPGAEDMLFEASGSVELNQKNFPDAAFREYIANLYDGNKDNALSEAELSNITSISVPNTVADVTGVKLFPKLSNLSIQNNLKIKSVDVSGCTELYRLWCWSDNALATVNASGCTKLEILTLVEMGLVSLDVSNCTKLESVSTTSDLLAKLNVKGCTALTSISASDAKLTELDISDCANLETLYCSSNSIKSLNVKGFKNLRKLDCARNSISTLDVSGCDSLTSLDCDSNGMTSLTLGGIDALQALHCEYNELTTLNIQGCDTLEGIVNVNVNPPDYIVDTVQYGSNYSRMLWCDSWVNIVGGNPAAPIPRTTAAEPVISEPVVAAPVIPTIAAVKKSSKTTIIAAPGSVYQLDLGGAVGKAFKSSKKKVATVNGAGLVTVKKAGKTKLTFKVGKKKRTVTLTIKDPTIPTAVYLNLAGSVPAQVGVPQVLTVTLPEGTTSGIKWKSSNKKVAKVANGVVTFKKAGKVTITATATRGKKKAKVKFVVSK